jgi:hypothetical protein
MEKRGHNLIFSATIRAALGLKSFKINELDSALLEQSNAKRVFLQLHDCKESRRVG